MSAFTALEDAALKAICDRYAGIGDYLSPVLATAKIRERDNTGHGFYTRFDVDRALPLPPESIPPVGSGPIAHMVDMGVGNMMGFILWFANGYPDCLEGFQYGASSGETVDLKSRDLRTLRFTSIEW